MKWIGFTKEEIEFLELMLPDDVSLGKKILRKLRRNSITVASRKSKGRNLQKWVCEQLASLLGIEYDQSDDQCLIHSREMGQSGVDVVLRGHAKEEVDIAFECKNTEKLDLRGAIRQAENNKGKYKDWSIIYKNKELKEPIVIISWSHFKRLLNDLHYYKSFSYYE